MIPTRTILLSFLTVCCVGSFQVMFDSVGSCSSTGLFECNMRVRKLNRTTAALVGNLSQTEDVGSNFKALIELFHSPLGNNQFYRYPMKIGPIGTCAFLEKF
ncbi:uncharacterized protein LOC119768731 [Culex quinquefasciatus]|uniref:uncharacterized protein LOC119768731 n=1 Tax=Culex quinquefasciatus TaxID=7176 RepID=UPI0018E38746|nr:uncharacterized protein LOC119768731 [Culex quinquefasciatus]